MVVCGRTSGHQGLYRVGVFGRSAERFSTAGGCRDQEHVFYAHAGVVIGKANHRLDGKNLARLQSIAEGSFSTLIMYLHADGMAQGKGLGRERRVSSSLCAYFWNASNRRRLLRKTWVPRLWRSHGRPGRPGS